MLKEVPLQVSIRARQRASDICLYVGKGKEKIHGKVLWPKEHSSDDEHILNVEGPLFNP